MRVLAVSNYFPPYHAGGYGVLCHRLCECLRHAGHDITVLTSEIPSARAADPGGYKEDFPVRRELAFVSGANAATLIWSTWRNMRTVAGCIDAVKPDLVYCFGIDGVGYQVYHTAVESGVPSVTVIGDTWLGQAWRDLPKFDPWHALATGRNTAGIVRVIKRSVGLLGKLFGLYTGTSPKSAGPVHAISSFLVDDLKSAGMPWTLNSHLMKYPLQPPFVSRDGEPVGLDGSTSRSLRVLFVSRMEPLKGPDIAIKGVAAAVRCGADVKLTLAGIGSVRMQSELQQLAKENEVEGRVKWAMAPDQDSLVALYRAHDVFVFPSLIVEGLGLVCLEAMACGLPVIATGRGGQLDLVKDGETGFLLEPGDVDELSRLLCRLATNPGLLKVLSRGAIAMARMYSSKQGKEEIVQWVEEAAGVDKNSCILQRCQKSQKGGV